MTEHTNDMTNAAYSEAYLKYRRETEADIFIRSAFEDAEEDALSDSLVWARKHYFHTVGDRMYRGSENTILRDGNQIYSFRNLENSGEFCKLIHHSNGNDYLLFRRDLYGYSVLNLSTLEDFHYYPACNVGNSKETFIWCDPIYNPHNDLLAVYGCYWGWPYTLILADFTDPFTPAENQAYIPSKKDIGDVETYLWQKNTLIIHSEHSKWKKGKKPKKGQGFNGFYVKKNTIVTNKTHKIIDALCRKWLNEPQ